MRLKQDRDTPYSPKDLATEIGIGYRVILGAIKAGQLPAYRFGARDGKGSRIRIWPDDAESWLNKHCRIGLNTPVVDNYRL